MAEKAFQPGSINYDGDIAANYAAARAFSPETAATWGSIVEPFVVRSYRSTVLDLGCGTGRFSALFAERFAAISFTPRLGASTFRSAMIPVISSGFLRLFTTLPTTRLVRANFGA